MTTRTIIQFKLGVFFTWYLTIAYFRTVQLLSSCGLHALKAMLVGAILAEAPGNTHCLPECYTVHPLPCMSPTSAPCAWASLPPCCTQCTWCCTVYLSSCCTAHPFPLHPKLPCCIMSFRSPRLLAPTALVGWIALHHWAPWGTEGEGRRGKLEVLAAFVPAATSVSGSDGQVGAQGPCRNCIWPTGCQLDSLDLFHPVISKLFLNIQPPHCTPK